MFYLLSISFVRMEYEKTYGMTLYCNSFLTLNHDTLQMSKFDILDDKLKL